MKPFKILLMFSLLLAMSLSVFAKDVFRPPDAIPKTETQKIEKSKNVLSDYNFEVLAQCNVSDKDVGKISKSANNTDYKFESHGVMLPSTFDYYFYCERQHTSFKIPENDRQTMEFSYGRDKPPYIQKE